MNPDAPILKIAVMVDGRIMVDGEAATTESLRVSLKTLAEQKGMVWYYREAAASEAPPIVNEITAAIAEHRLPIRFSTLADYSDAVGPWVKDKNLLEDLFRRARAAADASDPSGRRRIILVTPLGGMLAQNAPIPGSVPEQQVIPMQNMFPPDPPKTVVVVASTNISKERTIQSAIPFLGLLIGLAYIGHRIVVFNGQSAAMEAACRDADVMIVDGDIVDRLESRWYLTSASVMRQVAIYVHQRGTSKLEPFRPT